MRTVYIRAKTSLLGPFKKLNFLDDLIYITTYIISESKKLATKASF